MPPLLWDASAHVKRYYHETGTATVQALFATASSAPMVGSYMGYAETAAILRRKYNRGEIDGTEFAAARNLLETQVIDNLDFVLLSVEDEHVLAGIALSDTHNINSTDAAILATFLRYARMLPRESPTCVLVASDQRLLRAAAFEGLNTLNPETLAPEDLTAVLAALE